MASLALEKQQIEAELEDSPADTESWREGCWSDVCFLNKKEQFVVSLLSIV